jgi:ABC-2 type transport system permease protein
VADRCWSSWSTIPSIYGLGFAFASLVITAKEANAFVFLVRGLVMIFCGITFPVSLLPEWMHSVALLAAADLRDPAMRLAALSPAPCGPGPISCPCWASAPSG